MAAVHQPERSLLTRDGDAVGFDFLLLALGARSKRTLRQGQVWARGGDPSFLDQIILDAGAGKVRRVAVIVPRGARWPVPAYELALILAWAANDARVTLITAEEQPLGALGHAAADAVAGELDRAGVEVITGVEVIDEPLSGPAPPGLAELMLVPEEPVDEADALIGEPIDPARVRLGASSAAEFDRLISLPSVVGPFIAGVPTDAAGFIEVDAGLKVCGSERVWAAGGCIAAALEHSALAAQQADAAIAAIAAADVGVTGSISATPASRARTHRSATHRTARPMAGREFCRDARAFDPMSVVAPRTSGGSNARPTDRRVGSFGARGTARADGRIGYPSAGRAGLQQAAFPGCGRGAERRGPTGADARRRESTADGHPATGARRRSRAASSQLQA